MRSLAGRALSALALATSFVVGDFAASAQELPASGSFGLSFVYGTSPSGESGLFRLQPAMGALPAAYGATVPSVPSRWAHRRRTLAGWRRPSPSRRRWSS